ncbi:MAG: M28 family peptidase [candidate division Zixibacteria bacterium]|nr:M28 family peptidase [candidate division Zixibacteria bacterium]
MSLIPFEPAIDARAIVVRQPTANLDSLIALVAQDSITASLYRLQAFNGRVAGTDSIYAARDWIHSRFLAFGYDSVYNDSFSASVFGGYKPCYNVVATKLGTTRPDLQIVVGAHYDAVPGSPGADDNGSGVCGVLELARVLATQQTGATIVFVTFDAHEWGLYGSSHYANEAGARHDSILAMFNIDMIGNLPNSAEAWLYFGQDTRLAQIWADSGGSRLGIAGHPAPAAYLVDQYPFILNGYQALFVFEHLFSSVHHTTHDSTSYVNFDYATRMVKATLATVATIANADWDADGVANSPDNCPTTFNPGQDDLDHDGIGDACDPCLCLSQGDATGDGQIDVLDVVAIIDRAFAGGACTQDALCPRERCDIDANGTTDVFDVVAVIAYAFSNGPSPASGCP